MALKTDLNKLTGVLAIFFLGGVFFLLVITTTVNQVFPDVADYAFYLGVSAFIAGVVLYIVNLYTSTKSGQKSIGLLAIVVWDAIMVILALEMFLRHYRA
jgi:hypothetical protein